MKPSLADSLSTPARRCTSMMRSILACCCCLLWLATAGAAEPIGVDFCAMCGRSWPGTASSVMARTTRPGKPRCGSIAATTPRKPAIRASWRSCPANRGKASWCGALASDNPDVVMPPPAAKNPVTAAERESCRGWIAGGAEYKPHWAFEPPVQAALPPTVQGADWVRTPIDVFVLARLEREGLSPSPPADRHTLVRRVFLDLIGLPPTPEEVDQFVGDISPDAYEKLVDRLLASPHFGERWRGAGSTWPVMPTRTVTRRTEPARSGPIATG